MSCISILRMGYNEVDMVRLARPKGKSYRCLDYEI